MPSPTNHITRLSLPSPLAGTNSGHYPRHSISYAHLMQDAVSALARYRADVLSGAYPTAKHSIKISDEEFGRFMEAIS